MLPVINKNNLSTDRKSKIINKPNFKCLNQFQVLLPLINNETAASREIASKFLN